MSISPRLVVLSLDGVPHAMLQWLMQQGHMPNFARLCEEHGQPGMMRSSIPTVSSVAWATYATGRNPGKHGIFGFVDRKRGSYQVTFPNAAQLRGRNIWEILSAAGKKVFGMNVPTTYPPRAVNGILIGCFLAPSLDKVAYPAEVNEYLKSIEYHIDSDAQLARQSKLAMLEDLDVTLAKREQAMMHFLSLGAWDFFHTHIMGTDRINHFLLRQFREGHAHFAPAFCAYYRKVDALLGRLLAAIGEDTPLIILSDHGFCPITYEVQLSRYLVERGWTTPAERLDGPLSIDPARSKAFCLIPGRIFVNLRGREIGGSVPVEEYEATREALAAELLAMRDPQGRPVIRQVLKREEVYWPHGNGPSGNSPLECEATPYATAADLLAVPYDGYDLKMGLGAREIFGTSELEGMHTYHDAVLFTRGIPRPQGDFEIRQVAGMIVETLGVRAEDEMDLEYVPNPLMQEQNA